LKVQSPAPVGLQVHGEITRSTASRGGRVRTEEAVEHRQDAMERLPRLFEDYHGVGHEMWKRSVQRVRSAMWNQPIGCFF
jgi:hypothetical protein